ncbi:MAG TPA: FHA domain-containing protein, partial [Pyrinomonadaceae bacterium]|nr:FHA domain-containing protein [Pyrinomonadaceae bacterium]
MAVGIIIHISVGEEKRTEFFSEDRLSIGSADSCDLQIQTAEIAASDVWFELENTDGVYRITKFDPSLSLILNGQPIRRFIAVEDGDVLTIGNTGVSFGFFALSEKRSLIKANRAQTPIAQFIEEAALDAAASPKRDEAKAFLREFVRELSREVSWTTKLIILVLAIGFITGVLYLGFAVNKELREGREVAERQSDVIRKLEEMLGHTSSQIGELDKTNKDIIRTVSLAQNLRVDYGSGVCLIVGVYDLVDKSSGKVLRYPDAQANAVSPYEPAPSEDAAPQNVPSQTTLTTEGSGSPVEYDFIGTGFHVGGGYILTNRHVLQPWTEDDLVKQMIRDSNGKA